MPDARIAAVTGANRGLGLAIVRRLITEYPHSPLNNPPRAFIVYLACRSIAKGGKALKQLHSEPAIQDACSAHHIETRKAHLDVMSSVSRARFVQRMKSHHPEGIDVLVNNAGMAPEAFSSESVAETLETNYYGLLDLTRSLLPHMKQGGRMVNISSMVGKLNKYSREITARFKEARSVEDISALMEEYQKAVREGKHEERGWPQTAYGVSKAGVTGLTRVLGGMIQRGDMEGVVEGVKVNCCCPGYVRTDINKGRGRKSADQGAEDPVHLALGTIENANGEFWEHGAVSSW